MELLVKKSFSIHSKLGNEAERFGDFSLKTFLKLRKN